MTSINGREFEGSHRGDHQFADWAFIHALVEFEKKTGKKVKPQVDHVVKLVVDGEEWDFDHVMASLNEQLDRMVKEKAVELVQDQFGEIRNALYGLEEDVLHGLAKKLGVERER